MATAIIFYGEDHDSVVDSMRKHAMALLGVHSLEGLNNHGDYQEVGPTSKSCVYSMDVIHSVVAESALPPFRGEKRVIAMLSIDRMQKVHANALLKTLEDASDRFVLLLTTICYQDIIDTILSRVQKVYVPSRENYRDFKKEIENIFSLLSLKQYDLFFKEIGELDKSMKEQLEEAEKNLRLFFEDFIAVFISQKKAPHLVSFYALKIEECIHTSLESFHSNVSIKHILENLFLETQQLNYSK